MSDDYLYFKFRAINKHLIESLVNPSLYFAKPTDLNDPFDCRLKLDRFLEKAALSVWEQKFNSIGICSFSLVSKETLLWSHYADQHRGVCLLYRIPESFILDKKNKIIGVDKVNYGAERLMMCLTTKTTTDEYQFIVELTKSYLTTKSPSWQYEGEARIVRDEHGLLQIPGEFLEQVCFGLRTEQADIDLVTKLARAYCGCTKFCRMVRDESNFGFTMNKI